jgi:ribonucleoside-diphosphate reductase alpha chain
MDTRKKIEDFNKLFSNNALKMMRKRYLRVNDGGEQETPVDMFMRVAKDLASVEKEYGHDARFIGKVEREFFQIMANQEFTPAGRTLTNAGSKTSLVANCIVLPIDDSLESIFQTLKEAALLQQKGAGLGFALDNLRPSMSPVITTQGSSSGPVSFLQIYNTAFGIIKQQGRTGANMAMMSVEHPDVLDFIHAKEVEGKISNFNISVKVTDEFMEKLIKSPDEQWYCTWKKEWPGGPNKVKPRKVLRHPSGVVYDVQDIDITVGELFNEIVNYAWNNGEPGIVFIDTINKTNPLPDLGKIEASNPCGEQFLHPFDNCNLGSINLARFVKDKKVDYGRLEEVTGIAVRMLDNVIDRFDFPVEKITEMARKNRRIGLGIMGFADMLYQLGVQYNSDGGYKIAESVMGTIQKTAHETSQELAREKGVFLNYKKSIFADKRVRIRNSALTSVAPTGSISMMFECSSGIEPNFALAFIKQDKDGEQYKYLNKYLELELKNRKFSSVRIEEIKNEVLKTGSIQHLQDLPQDLRNTFVVATDISGEDHVKMQAAFQKYVDNSISKTINFPNSATREDVSRAYVLAWRLGCKSCTVYRDGSRVVQVLNVGGDGSSIVSTTGETKDGVMKEQKYNTQALEDTRVEEKQLRERKRPEVLVGKTYRVRTGYGNLFITINSDETGMPFEVFATLGKSGGYFQEQTEAITRLISLALRSNINPLDIIEHLKGIRGPMITMTPRGTILSLPDAIGKILEEHISLDNTNNKEEVIEEIQEEILITSGHVQSSNPNKKIADFGFMPGCPDCGSPLVMAEGCVTCKNCGYSRCF